MAGNQYFSAVEQTLPSYIPMPLDTVFEASKVIQQRSDINMAALDEQAQRLASMNAKLPYHRQYVNELTNNYRKESEELLAKYNNNAADPNFNKDLRRLVNKYATDPNIGIINMANQLYDQKLKDISKLNVEGKKFIDSNRNPMGIDENGNLTFDVGAIKATEFDNNIRNRFKDALQAKINDGKGNITNAQAIQMVMRDFVTLDDEGNITGLNTNDNDIREAMQYYTGQGLSNEGAAREIIGEIQSAAASNTMYDKRYDYENFKLSEARFNLENAKFRHQLAMDAAKENRALALVPLSSSLEVKDLNKGLIDEANRALRFNDANAGFVVVPDTPENRQKYPNAERVKGGSAGTGAAGTPNLLRLTNEQAKIYNKELVESARTEIGHVLKAKGIDPSKATKQQVLSTYIEYLEADNNAPTFWTSPVKEIGDNITRLYIGNDGGNLGDAIIEDRKGNITRVAGDKEALKNLEGFSFAGITASPIKRGGQEYSNGAMKATAVDKDGNIVTIYKPLPPRLQQDIYRINAVDKVMLSGMSNAQLQRSKEFMEYSEDGKKVIVPQKVNGQVEYYELGKDGKITGPPLTGLREEIEDSRRKIAEYFSLHQNTD